MNGEYAESLLTADELVSAVKGVSLGDKNISFSSVVTDSRNAEPGSLFVALVGEKQDGHVYISSAVDKGASVILAVGKNWEKLPELERRNILGRAAVVVVENTLYALQAAAARYVKKFPDLIRVGITGSNGKTTTKEIALAVLSQKYKVVATEGNLNSETGLPLSVFKIRKEHEAGIFEMGMNRVNEIGELAEVLCPSYAIITNIGTAHIGILGSKDNIAEEKKKIFSQFHDDSCMAFVPGADEYAAFLADIPVGHVRYFGRDYQDNVKDISEGDIEGTRFNYCGETVNFPLPGAYNFSNMLAVIALAEALSIPSEKIRAGLESVKPLFGRSRLLSGTFSIVQDCYNANAESMAESIRFYGQSKVKGKKIFIIGDMRELGSVSADVHKGIGALAASQRPFAVFFVGSEMVAAYEAACLYCREKQLEMNLFSEENIEDASVIKVAEKAAELLSDGDLVLVKGSRGVRLERVVSVLCDKAGLSV
ncbi:MAG: UDP-N-acetylmuramoyl-tripeptide--D-alanyl-D-alanine ligase [Treponemataceae bacterium]|nr:UDP-N-acetylmuramoyl-tripeptide--D-alanyl-D-alanine ligase [Treponemataceae bacterium]